MPSNARDERVVRGDFVMVSPPGRKIVGSLVLNFREVAAWLLSQRGMSRIEDGKTGGILPRVCSAACIATM
jgi:hypothetical protein